MKEARPRVRLISRPLFDERAAREYLRDEVGDETWIDRVENALYAGPPSELMGESEALVEFGGRLCYRSWAPGLNPNVTQVREDSGDYLENVIAQRHGSVLEHAYFVFLFSGVSRVFTHELVRHRVGTSISQESMRYVRLEDLPFWFPDWAREDAELMERSMRVLAALEDHQKWMAKHFALDEPGRPFAEKKLKTSFMRRFAPDGVATAVLWGANVRTLRHVLETRTDKHAEEEMRIVFDQVGEIIVEEAPMLFGDFAPSRDGWKPQHSKV